MMYKHVKQLLSCSSDIMGSPANDTAQKKKKKKNPNFLPAQNASEHVTAQQAKTKYTVYYS